MSNERISLIVWLTNLKNNKRLDKLGNVVYISQKMKYAIIYINKNQYEEVTGKLEEMNFVKKIDRSLNIEVVEHFSNSLSAKEN